MNYCRCCLNPGLEESGSSIDLFDDKQRPHIVTEKLRQFVNIPVFSDEQKLPFKVCQNCVVNLDFCIQFVDRIRRIDQCLRNQTEIDSLQSELTSHYPYLYGSNEVQNKNPQTVPFQRGVFFGKTSIEKKNKNRKILPKKNPQPNPAQVKTHVQNGQYMIPVTVMTPCKNCNLMIKAASVQDLQNHVCSSKEKRITCAIENCNKKFFTQVTLRYHLKHYHKMGQQSAAVTKKAKKDDADPTKVGHTDDDKAKYVCSWPNCNKAYQLKNYLDQHHRTHTGERPFSCNNCSRGFLRILDLKKHQLLKVCTLNSK